MTQRPPLPPGLTRRPKVGVVLAFTGHYDSVRLLSRFLHHAGLEVVTSQTSTAPIIEAGTALASADFCFPVRVYVGHAQALSRQHPDLDAILAPNVWSERAGTATCPKYRDVGGIAIRSLGGMVPYLEGRHPLPRLVRPNIHSLTRDAMLGVAFNVYAEILRLPAPARAGFFLPPFLRPRWAPHLAHVEAAFGVAWREVMERPRVDPAARMADPTRPRLALVGRRYLLNDPALSADLKPWFARRGAVVLTASDVPWEELADGYRRVDGFYDSHREGQAFIDWAADKVDGFIIVGSFGCHPDAFQVDYLAERARSKGKPAWTFRFDETAGTAGFQTRFETVYGFLEQQRDRRLGRVPPPASAAAATSTEPQVVASPERTEAAAEHPATGAAPKPAVRRPLFIWPYMGEELNLVLEELLIQMGLRELALPPRPIDGETLLLGNRRYTESCSPYACATGSLIQGVRVAVQELREQATSQGRRPEPRRIIGLMLRGEGPCTFGWYAIAQNHHLPADMAADLGDGHTLELMTMGLNDAVGFLNELTRLGNARRLGPVVRYVEARIDGRWAKLGLLARLRLLLGFQLAARAVLRPVWAKLHAAETVRARSLLVRAHERRSGDTTAAYHECLGLLRRAHSRGAIHRALRLSLARLNAVPQDPSPRPRVASVGEIYVALTSFANRGVVENLLGREGVEVVEGITLSGFIHGSLREIRRRALANHPWVRPLRRWLADRNIRWLEQRPRDLRARPFLEWEVGGEGMPGVAAARALVEAGCDGIIHTYPFKCMPEGIAKDAYKEMADLYGVRYLGMSFDKELEIERVKTEVATFAALLKAQGAAQTGLLARLGLRFHRWAVGWRVQRLRRKSSSNRGTARVPPSPI